MPPYPPSIKTKLPEGGKEEKRLACTEAPEPDYLQPLAPAAVCTALGITLSPRCYLYTENSGFFPRTTVADWNNSENSVVNGR